MSNLGSVLQSENPTTGRKAWRRGHGCWRRLSGTFGWLLLCSTLLNAETLTKDSHESIRRFKGMSLDELLDQQVISVSRTPVKVSATPAAIQVITGEQIQRSAATTLPEALRLAANLQVAQAGASSWAISARGFNNTLANKLLVMIDGRTIYTPLYAGVFWDVQNVLLEDVDRIEVVSGPGGTMWGANAVNGVINVITKHAKDTQGTYVSGAAGTFLQDFGAVRHGGGNGSNLFYRAYVQRFDFDSTELSSGASAGDRWHMNQGGFRVDWAPVPTDAFTLQGDFYAGELNGSPSDTPLNGQNLLGRWTHTFDEESDLRVQLYVDRTWRDIPGTIAEDLKTYDVDVQHRFPFGERQSIVWGAGYRVMQDRIRNRGVAFLPAHKNLELFSAFIQDEITLVPERLKFTFGTKIEYNEYSHFEYQPSGRLAWTPTDRQTVWTAISRAVRSPSRIDTEYYTPAPPVVPGTPNLAGGAGFDSEKLLSFELGYRIRPAEPLWLSVATYYNYYTELRSLDQVTPNNFVIANNFRSEVWGVELAAEYAPLPWWRLRGGYNFIHKDLWIHGGANVNASVREGNDPEHQFSFQSLMDLPAHFQFDLSGRYVSRLPSPVVPSYFSLDARLAWQHQNVELAVVGQNLLDAGHREFGTREIPRGVFGKVTWRF